jgi:hypothetical protein
MFKCQVLKGFNCLERNKATPVEEHPGLLLKIRKIYDFMFHGFPFRADRLD